MIKVISVIVPTFNPNPDKLNQTIMGLKNQGLTRDEWELIIVDNCSTNPVKIDLSWHPNAEIISEDKKGLTSARLAGFKQAKGEIIVLVDDDNILAENYLEEVKRIFNASITLGAIGGKSLPLFEADPPVWLKEFYCNLALRDLGEEIIESTWQEKYPEAAPIGAGMAIRKEALQSYQTKKHTISDRKGNGLSSGGDNDIVLEILKSGWQVAYYPTLSLQHIIPVERMQKKYLARLINNTNQSWIELLESHGINPWKKIKPWSVPMRKTKAWLTYKAWLTPANYIKWKGACGLFEGLSK
ncbi:glycosyltransferase [Pedobacter sp. MW01-1-1]|uniref:glycosyltransferase n=1 Tax=Pedobacter sp. MW01-1-1 TaxID=3383027 RepID=UPI003FF0E9B7